LHAEIGHIQEYDGQTKGSTIAREIDIPQNTLILSHLSNPRGLVANSSPFKLDCQLINCTISNKRHRSTH